MVATRTVSVEWRKEDMAVVFLLRSVQCCVKPSGTQDTDTGTSSEKGAHLALFRRRRDDPEGMADSAAQMKASRGLLVPD